MAVERFEDLRPYLNRVREKLWEAVAACPPDVLGTRPAPEAWSVLEHMEHLARSEPFMVRILEDLAEDGRARGALAAPGARRAVSALDILAPQAGRKFQAPDYSRPTGEWSLPELRARIDTSRARLLAALDDLEALDTDDLVARHPFGWELNACQWVHFTGIHESLHTRHIRDVLAALAAG